MLFNTDLKLALRCAHCSKTEIQEFSLFSLSGGWAVDFRCSCGECKFILSPGSTRQSCRLDVVCPICEIPHTFSFKFKELFGEQLHILYCKETGLEICCLGWGEEIGQRLEQNRKNKAEDLWGELGCSEYFRNPEVMFKCLDYLHGLANSGEIFCQCGNKKIEVEVLPEKIELSCSRCASLGMIFAETEEDYLALRKVGRIEMLENGFKRIAMPNPILPGSSRKLE